MRRGPTTTPRHGAPSPLESPMVRTRRTTRAVPIHCFPPSLLPNPPILTPTPIPTPTRTHGQLHPTHITNLKGEPNPAGRPPSTRAWTPTHEDYGQGCTPSKGDEKGHDPRRARLNPRKNRFIREVPNHYKDWLGTLPTDSAMDILLVG